MAADGGSNEQDDKKRRLQLMPEVLPDPKKAGGTGSVRQRTIKTMERLIAVSAASAIIGGASAVGGCGYGVVDPLPPPSNCPNIASTITAKATWKLDNGQYVVIVELSVPGKTDASYVDADPSVTYGGTLVSRTLNQGALSIVIKPASNTENAGLSVQVHCSAGNANLSIDIEINQSAPADGASIPISVYDGF